MPLRQAFSREVPAARRRNDASCTKKPPETLSLRPFGFLLALGMLTSCQNAPPVQTPDLSGAVFLHVSGEQIVNALNEPVRLRGVTFGNRTRDPDPIARIHHGPEDYRRVAEMGMNVVRFQMSYRHFERDIAPAQFVEEGWQWLERNIRWAGEAGVYLILSLEVPPGAQPSSPERSALWRHVPLGDHFIALWRAIAERCSGSGIVAGYNLLHEPHVPASASQWQELATRTIEAIREVDPHHIVFLERVHSVNGSLSEDGVRNFVKVADPNVVYEFHFFRPFDFTHQRDPSMATAAEYTRYPDPERIGIPGFLTDHEESSGGEPALPPGDSDWRYYEGAPVTITDPSWVIGRPAMVSSNNSGVAMFDNLVVEELDENGAVRGPIQRMDLTTKRGWFLSSSNGTGKLLTRHGRDDATCLGLSGTTGPASITSDYYRFALEPGAAYRISGWVKGERIPAGADCRIRLDILSARAPVHRWDRAYLAEELDAYLAWGRKYRVPMFLGALGTNTESFQQNRGGLRWVSDMLTLLEERNLHFAYRAYHDDAFGIYFGEDDLPSPERCNQRLIDLFRTKLMAQTSPPEMPEVR